MESNVAFQCQGKEEKERCRGHIPCVSLGMGEMKCELRKWNERKVQCRITITGRAQQTVKEKTEECWTKHHPVPVPLATQRP